jgi:peptide/nickel transport system substrate-binding protein
MNELEYLKQQHIKGRISRRELLGRAAALGVGAALVSSLAASVDAYAAETPRKGGKLTIGLAGGSTTDSLDFRTTTDSMMIDSNHGIWNCLAKWDQDGRPHPELAESWEGANGAKDWIVKLRKGVTFSNGKEFTADDAIYSLNLHRGDTKSGGATSVKSVTDIKKLDDHQIQISLSAADSDFPYGLTDYHLMMVPDGFKDWAKPVGTGPFVVENFDPGVRLRLKKARPYWKEGKGLLDGVDVTVINDSSARLNALISGQMDAINRVDHKAVALLSKSPRIEVVRAPGGWFSVLAMQVDKAPYDNPDLRMALMLATDREQMLKALFSGYGTPGNDHPIPPTDPYFNKELAQRKNDPDKAAFHFKKAGLSDPKIVLQASDAAFNGAVDQATLLQASAAKAGIKIDVKKEPADGYFDNVWLKAPFVSSYWAGRPAATQMLAVAFEAGAPWNETHWNDAPFEKLLADARAETDEAKRKPYIWEMQAILNGRGGALIPVFRDFLDAHNQKVGGHTPHGGYDMNNGWIMEDAWLKS